MNPLYNTHQLPILPPGIPGMPPIRNRDPQITKLEQEPAKRPIDAEDDNNNGSNEKSLSTNQIEAAPSLNNVSSNTLPPTHDFTVTLVPIAAVCALVLSLGVFVYTFRHRLCGSRKCKKDKV